MQQDIPTYMINTTFELSHVQICIRHIYQAAAAAAVALVSLPISKGTNVVSVHLHLLIYYCRVRGEHAF